MLRNDLPILTPLDSLYKGMSVLDEKGLEVALILEGEKLIGVLTDGDVRRALLKGHGLQSIVKDCMQVNFTWVHPNLGRAEVLDLMKARGFKQIPVLGPEGTLIGLHTIDDLLGATPRDNHVLILCGGLGTRLRPLTETIPKPMLQVAGRPILERLVLHLVGHGFRKIHLAIHYLGEMIQSHFGDGSQFGCEIQYIRENQPLGTGGALRLMPAGLGNPSLVLNGDLITQFDPGRMLERHLESGNRITIGSTTHTHEVPFGVLQLVDGCVRGLQEKPRLDFPVSAGVYLVDSDLGQRITPDTFTPITWLIEESLRRDEKVGYFPMDEQWADIGRHEELQRARGEG